MVEPSNRPEFEAYIPIGRYCETLGFLSMSGVKSSNYTGNMKPNGVPNPTQKAIKVSNGTATASASLSTATTLTSGLVYFRRYLDWNRLTFAYHAVGSQSSTFDFNSGENVTSQITEIRKELNLTTLYGCAPETYCQSCRPFGAEGNIFGLLETALAATVINESRADIPRLIIINTGTIRFDLVEGPFTLDDSFIVSPFPDAFQFIPDVPYSIASQVLGILNAGPYQKKRRDLETRDFDFLPLVGGDACVDPVIGGSSHDSHNGLRPRSGPMTRGKHRRQTTTLTPGYATIGKSSCYVRFGSNRDGSNVEC